MSKLYNILLFVLLWSKITAQPFLADIQAFKVQDSLHKPPKKAILFIGSSSFTIWKDVQDYFPSRKILNRGFGGSSLTDLIRYKAEIIAPYQPKQIVIYCGENDLAADSSVSAEIVLMRFSTLFASIREMYPKTPIIYISMKPSPSRAHLMGKMQAGNALIKKFLNKHRRTFFADVFSLMLKPDGQPNEALFLEDMLHMNKKGYVIWQKVLSSRLK